MKKRTESKSEAVAQKDRGNWFVICLFAMVLLLLGTNLITASKSHDRIRGLEQEVAFALSARGDAERKERNFDIINAHDHLYRLQDLPKYLKAAETMGIVKTVFVASSEYTIMGKGDPAKGNEENTMEILKCAEKYPGKIIPFATLHPDDENKVEMLERYVAAGVKGLKLYNGHGNFHDRPLDVEEMLPVYEYCEETGLPICWHINMNRYTEEFTRVMLSYPKLKVFIPHFGVGFFSPGGTVMKNLAKIMDIYPNVYVDSSFGTRSILVSGLEKVSANPEIFREFYEKYQSRILWGTDMVVTGNKEKTEAWVESVLRACRDMHEKEVYSFWMASKGCEYAIAGSKNTYGRLRGLNLPDEILEKVYKTNIERFLGLDVE